MDRSQTVSAPGWRSPDGDIRKTQGCRLSWIWGQTRQQGPCGKDNQRPEAGQTARGVAVKVRGIPARSPHPLGGLGLSLRQTGRRGPGQDPLEQDPCRQQMGGRVEAGRPASGEGGMVTGLAREVEKEALRRGWILDESEGGFGMTG